MKTKTKKNIIKAVVGTAVAGVVAFAGWLGCAFWGNPLEMHKLSKAAEEYVEKKYPDENYEISKCTFDWKLGNYYVTAQSPTSEDTRFTIRSDYDGGFTDNHSAETFQRNAVERFLDALKEDVRLLFEDEFGSNIELTVGIISDDESPVVAIDQLVDLENFPWEISIQMRTNKGDKTEDEMVEETVDRIAKTLGDKYTVGEYTFYYSRGDGGNNWVTLTAEEAARIQ